MAARLTGPAMASSSSALSRLSARALPIGPPGIGCREPRTAKRSRLTEEVPDVLTIAGIKTLRLWNIFEGTRDSALVMLAFDTDLRGPSP